MSRKKAFKEPEKSRHIKYLLYEDNQQHMTVLEKIRSDDHAYIGIRHHIQDMDGQDIIDGEGKPHYHVYQEFSSPVYPAACAKRYGLLDDSGKVSTQFCRCVSGSWSNALVYLTHLNAPDKELYPDSDLFGWGLLLRKYAECALNFLKSK